MATVDIELRRFDSKQNEDLSRFARMGADAFGWTADLSFDSQLAQLLRLRVSQVNNCTFCLNVHYWAARELDIPAGKIDMLAAWWETGLFTDAEQAALAYTEALCRVADTTVADAFEAYHRRLAEHFTESQIVEIAAVVINMNLWTRLKLAEGATPIPADSTDS